MAKAGAHGHGLEEIAKTLAAEGIAISGMANAGEVRRVRTAAAARSDLVRGTRGNPRLRLDTGHPL